MCVCARSPSRTLRALSEAHCASVRTKTSLPPTWLEGELSGTRFDQPGTALSSSRKRNKKRKKKVKKEAEEGEEEEGPTLIWVLVQMLFMTPGKQHHTNRRRG